MEDSFEVECPSGLKGLVRPIQVQDINALANRQARKRGDGLSRMLSGVWLETLEPAIYESTDIVRTGEKISSWSRILQGDRSWLILESRRLTWGDEFYFRIPCGNPMCRKQINWRIDLKELQVSGLSEDAMRIIAEAGVDNAVVYKDLPKAQVKVGFRFLQGLHQRNVESVRDKGEDEMNIAGLLARLAYIEGATSSGERRKFVKTMHMLDVEYLREQWEKDDIFVQDTIEIECQSCNTIQDIIIPTDARFFSAKSTKPMTSSKEFVD